MSGEEVLFAFEDPERRTFLAISRDRSYYHAVAPARADDPRCQPREDADGNQVEPLLQPGDLTCTCKGATYRGTCYVVEAAKDLLVVNFARVQEPHPVLVGAGESVEAFRG